MAMIAEEVLKAIKYKELEGKYGNVRKGLKMSLVAFLKDNPHYEKMISDFIGTDLLDKKIEADASFIDELPKISKLMDDAYNQLDNSTGGALVHKLSTISAIIIEQMGRACIEAKINFFPIHKEKFLMYISEEQEAKAIIPKTGFKSIKTYLDKWFFLMQQYSVNVKAKIIYTKLNNFRDKFYHFEYITLKSINQLQKSYRQELNTYFHDTRLALLRMRKFFEAIDASAFGKMIKELTDIALENGARLYAKYNGVLEVPSGNGYRGGIISIQELVDKYDEAMFFIRQTIAELETKMGSSRLKDPSKAFWDISSQITSFRDGIQAVVKEFSKGLNSDDQDLKFFTYTAQAVLIPYMNQSRGEINNTFVSSVKNLDIFFWKLMTKIFENSQVNGEKIDEIIGLAVRITQKELEEFVANKIEYRNA